MKKLLSAALILIMIALPALAHAEAKPEDILLMFQGEPIACHPIAFTRNDVGEYALILYIEGLDDFVMSQQYNVTAPIYACTLNDAGNPLQPRRIVWDRDISNCCYFFYAVTEAPETLSLVPLDSVSDPTTWRTLTLADIPCEVPEAYVLPPKDWNDTDDQTKAG